MNINKRFWLEEIRNQAGLKQYQVANQTGISRGYYSAIENGIRKTPGDVALKISMILNFPMEKFYLEDIQEWIEQRKAEEVIENV